MSKPKIEMNNSAIRALLKSDGIMKQMQGLGNEIASRAGNASIESDIFKKRGRVRVAQDLTKEDDEGNTLLKAVHFNG